MNNKKRNIAVLIFSASFLVFSFLLSLSIGSVKFSLKEVIFGIFCVSEYEKQSLIILSLRLPRTIGAVLSGAALSAAGLMLQQATGNDLCSSNIIGANAGAGFFVILLLCLFPGLYYYLPSVAFIGAITATLLVIVISQFSPAHSRKTTLILAGVAVGAFFNAGISFLSYRFPDALLSYTSFTSGSISGVYFKDIAVPGCIISVCIILAFVLSGKLKLLCIGDKMAYSLGINVKRIRIYALILSSALCASSVAFAGLIGFVGIIIPHAAKKFISIDSGFLLPVSVLFGGTTLILSDLIGRTLFAPSELPCGIITSALGAPFFIFLLCRKRGTE